MCDIYIEKPNNDGDTLQKLGILIVQCWQSPQLKCMTGIAGYDVQDLVSTYLPNTFYVGDIFQL